MTLDLHETEDASETSLPKVENIADARLRLGDMGFLGYLCGTAIGFVCTWHSMIIDEKEITALPAHIEAVRECDDPPSTPRSVSKESGDFDKHYE